LDSTDKERRAVQLKEKETGHPRRRRRRRRRRAFLFDVPTLLALIFMMYTYKHLCLQERNGQFYKHLHAYFLGHDIKSSPVSVIQTICVFRRGMDNSTSICVHVVLATI